MFWYLLVAMILGFVIGFVLCQELCSKKISKLAENLNEDFSKNWKDTFDAGWNAANSNVANVKLQYDKLVNPLKYAPKED